SPISRFRLHNGHQERVGPFGKLDVSAEHPIESARECLHRSLGPTQGPSFSLGICTDARTRAQCPHGRKCRESSTTGHLSDVRLSGGSPYCGWVHVARTEMNAGV